MKYFYLESGLHRVQRVPPTEGKGRIHTSIINVMLIDDLKASEIKINKKEIIVSYYKDSGAGGQHRNKTMSGVRLQYKGHIIECCETRDQRKNKEIAFERLKEKIEEKNKNKIQNRINKQFKK